ncbi:MAG: hypothetical protein KGL18_01865 [Burkholderiales bacterium]|nr:hypothetical protein [Burkholderiales bacterium]MDE1927521.1 hypothetical protein [Burkholderiales bacterium]MDE2501713.1 hypothetical protein [Burkholderiales bacterium]
MVIASGWFNGASGGARDEMRSLHGCLAPRGPYSMDRLKAALRKPAAGAAVPSAGASRRAGMQGRCAAQRRRQRCGMSRTE